MRFLSESFEAFRIAVQAILANKARGILTTLGIIIGIVAVVTTMTAANGLRNSFQESISAVGSDVLYVSRMPWVFSGNFFQFRNRERLTLRDAEKLAHQLRTAKAVNPTTSTLKPIKYRSETLSDIDIIGTTDQHIRITAALPEFGRFLLPSDMQSKKRVCVIGSEIREKLFGDINPINKRIRIGRERFLVVGVMEKQGSAGFFGGPNFDSQIFVPITTFVKAFGGANRNFNIAVKAPSQEELADFEYAVIGEMRKIRKLRPTDEEDFSINQMSTLTTAYDNVMGVIVQIGLLITGMSLLVGGIGVMNIMFVSVTERTREVGIRKAIGAKRRTILSQFLIESAIICLIGGTIGVALSFGIAELINAMLMPAQLSGFIVTVALVVSALVGIVSGLAPAVRAARLRPIDALRYE